MKILLLVSDNVWERLHGHPLLTHEIERSDNDAILEWSEADFNRFDLIIFGEENPETFPLFQEIKSVRPIVLIAAVTRLLAEFYAENAPFSIKTFGLNALPGFIERKSWEISCLKAEDRPVLEKLSTDLGVPFHIIEDQVGMVAPRVLACIINEAYFMRQEGSADTEAIDLAMKLGVNYPKGPFEWANQIGVTNIYNILDGLNAEQPTGQYVIARSLRQAYLAEIATLNAH